MLHPKGKIKENNFYLKYLISYSHFPDPKLLRIIYPGVKSLMKLSVKHPSQESTNEMM